jgi:hypothetical protein
VVGATAIAVAASVVIDNTVVGWAGSPTYAAPIKEVLAFHAHHSAAVAIAVGLEALTLPLLLLFVTGLHGLVGRRGGAGADWSRLAVAAGATFSAVTAFYAVLWDGVVLSAGQLTEPSPVLEVAWQMHAAAFAWSLPALGATFIGAWPGALRQAGPSVPCRAATVSAQFHSWKRTRSPAVPGVTGFVTSGPGRGGTTGCQASLI